MKILGVHHVAFAHSAESEAVEALTTLLGLEVGHEEGGDGFAERMLVAGDTYVQLLEPTGPGVVGSFIDKRGSALHHIAFEVADIEAAVSELKDKGAHLVDATPRPGGMGTRIAFVHPRTFGGLLVELVEVDKSEV